MRLFPPLIRRQPGVGPGDSRWLDRFPHHSEEDGRVQTGTRCFAKTTVHYGEEVAHKATLALLVF